MKEKCDECGSDEVAKNGTRTCKKGKVQTYLCKDCGKRFTPKDGFRRMKHDKKLVTTALDLYAKGLSLRGISHHLKMFHGFEISHVGILYWIRKYGKLLKDYAEKLKPEVSEKLFSDDTVVPFNARKNWLWNVMDSRSRFWIAGHLSVFKTQNHADEAFKMTKQSISNEPESIATDGAFAYVGAIGSAFRNSEHTRYTKPEEKGQMQIMERLHGNLKQRTKTMRGMWCCRTARQIIGFWQVYYNFIRPHSALNGATPADFIGLRLGLDGNKWERLIEAAAGEMS